MRFNFGKIVAIATSTLMVGLTVGTAAAANYPAPFVVGGSADVAVVYGTGAGASSLDLIQAGNIQTNLQSFMTGGGGSTTTTTGGDSVLLAKSSDNLNLGDGFSVFTGSVDNDDLTTLLADGTYVADDNDEFDFEQSITLGTSPNLTHFRDSDYENLIGLTERTPVLGFKLKSSTHVLNYTLDFTQDAESDVVGTSGGGELDDLEGSDIVLFGKSFYVSDWKNGTDENFTGKLTLLDSAITSLVSEGESTSVTVEGTTYQISLEFIDSAGVKFNVNGDITNKLAAGETFRLSTNAYIGVREINTQDYQGGIKNTEFSIGSGKLELTHGSDAKLNDDTLQGVVAFLNKGSSSSGVSKVDKIVIRWTTDKEEFISSETELEMPGFGGVKFSMSDFVRSTEEKLTIQPDGDESIELTIPIKDGTVRFNLLFSDAGANAGNFTGIGKAADERLATSTNSTLVFFPKKNSGADFDSWFVASYNLSSQAESYLLKATVTQDTTDGRNETDIFRHDGTGWGNPICDDKIVGKTCDIGDVSLTINAIGKVSGAEEFVSFEAGTNVHFNTIYTAGGLRMYLPVEATSGDTFAGAINLTAGVNGTAGAGHNPDSFFLEFAGENKDEDLGGGQEFNMTLDATAGTNNPLHVVNVNRAGTGGPSGLELGDTSTYETYVVDDVAPRILHYTNPDEDSAEVYYPTGDSESYGEVFLAETGTIFSAGVASGGGALGDVIVKDSEVSSVSSKNLIVVGGSCINSVAANLVGGALCGSSWTDSTSVGSGQFLIQSFGDAYSSGKVALLVAGYEAADTVNAATFLRTQAVDTAAGTTYIGTSSTSAELQVA